MCENRIHLFYFIYDHCDTTQTSEDNFSKKKDCILKFYEYIYTYELWEIKLVQVPISNDI